MRRRTMAGVAALAGIATALTGLGTTSAVAGNERHPTGAVAPARVVTKGLDGPFGLDTLSSGRFAVAENVSGQVTVVRHNGTQRVVVSGAPGISGVATRGNRVWSVIGGPDETGRPSGGKYGSSRVLRTNLRTGKTAVIANLLRYELRHNPDHQVQFVKGKPVDALSNPFAMTMTPMGLLVADGGANDVLKVNPRTGRVSTFFVPPTVKARDVKACAKAQANPGTKGCDPVPTGVVWSHGSVYVSTLGAEVPRAGRIYKLGPGGRVQKVFLHLNSPTGVAVAPNRSIYFSQVLQGAPEGDGPPPPGFDPSSVGQIVRIGPHGKITRSQVTMPTGLVTRGGKLFASTWSIASFLGLQHAGRIQEVPRRTFH